jgi:RNA polymerase sigma-70 factor (ECF subfamily)
MAHSVHSHRPPSSQGTAYDQPARHRLRRLRHLHRPSRERQVALVRRTRRARLLTQPSSANPVETALRDEMLNLLPNLWAFAFSLTNDPIRVDDLVQETFVRAWANIDCFERGSNPGAWLFTILRHAFYTEHRKRRHEVEDPIGVHADRLKGLPAQEAALALAELRSALAHLPSSHREALLLVSVEGMTYDEVAMLQGVAVGTIKSRVNRARQQLAGLLQMKSRHENVADPVMQAAMQKSMSLFSAVRSPRSSPCPRTNDQKCSDR